MSHLWIKRKDKNLYLEPQARWLHNKRPLWQNEPLLRDCIEPMSGCLATPFFK